MNRCRFYRYIFEQQGYAYPAVAWAISAVETGCWNPHTTIYRHHNLFAFKRNKRGFYARIGKGGYAEYTGEADSFADYEAYELQVMRKYNLFTQAAFINHIVRRYNHDPRYRSKLMRAIHLYQSLKFQPDVHVL